VHVADVSGLAAARRWDLDPGLQQILRRELGDRRGADWPHRSKSHEEHMSLRALRAALLQVVHERLPTEINSGNAVE
jgi:hypothetical protein